MPLFLSATVSIPGEPLHSVSGQQVFCFSPECRLNVENEYEIFNRTQKIDFDFDREVRKMLEGMKGNE